MAYLSTTWMDGPSVSKIYQKTYRDKVFTLTAVIVRVSNYVCLSYFATVTNGAGLTNRSIAR